MWLPSHRAWQAANLANDGRSGFRFVNHSKLPRSLGAEPKKNILEAVCCLDQKWWASSSRGQVRLNQEISRRDVWNNANTYTLTSYSIPFWGGQCVWQVETCQWALAGNKWEWRNVAGQRESTGTCAASIKSQPNHVNMPPARTEIASVSSSITQDHQVWFNDNTQETTTAKFLEQELNLLVPLTPGPTCWSPKAKPASDDIPFALVFDDPPVDK